MTSFATQHNRLKYTRLVHSCLVVCLCLCLIDCGGAQLTFHSDANTNSFMLKAPGIQQFFTRNFGKAKSGNLKAHQTDFTINAGTDVTTNGAAATPTTLATPTTAANLAQFGAQQYQQYNPSHAAHYPQRSAGMQYNGLQHTAYSQAHYAAAGATTASAQPVRAMARPLVAQQYQHHQSQQPQHAQLYQTAAAQPQSYARAQPQYDQLRALEQLQQVEPNDVGSYATEPQAEQQVSAPQHQQQYLQYQQQQQQQQKDIQAALLYAYQQQSQQQQQQLQQQQQILAQQQQMKMHNEKYQQQLLKQLYETHPPVIGNRIPGTNFGGRDVASHGRAGTGDQNYTVQNYYDFLQNQHEKTLSDQQQQMQQYRNYATPTDASEVATTLPSSPAAASTAYSPASQVSSVRYSGGGSQYMFR